MKPNKGQNTWKNCKKKTSLVHTLKKVFFFLAEHVIIYAEVKAGIDQW